MFQMYSHNVYNLIHAYTKTDVMKALIGVRFL